MSRISLTEAGAEALDDARWTTRTRRHGDLLRNALDGNEAAVAAIAAGWPADTSGARSRFVQVPADVMDRLAELANSAEAKPSRGPQAPAMLGIDEMIRLYRAR